MMLVKLVRRNTRSEDEKLGNQKDIANVTNWTVAIGRVVGTIAIIAAMDRMAASAALGLWLALP